MTTLLIRGRAKRDVQMLRELAERLGLQITELTAQEKEDIGLALAVKEGRRSPTVGRASVMRALERK